MNTERFPRTDRPGSGIYRGEEGPALAFDDYRSADEHQSRHRGEKGIWRGLIGIFRGGARRHEEKLLKSASIALAHDPTVETDRILVTIEEGELKVSGSVTNRWMKEKVTDCLLRIPEVRSIRNELTVRPRHHKLPQEGPLAI